MSETLSYKMPKVDVGMDVWWYPHGDLSQQPFAAKVTRLAAESVCLSIFHPDNYNLMIRDGVRHLSDPRRKDSEDVIESGLWDHPRGEAYKELDRRLKQCEKALDLNKAVAAVGSKG